MHCQQFDCALPSADPRGPRAHDEELSAAAGCAAARPQRERADAAFRAGLLQRLRPVAAQRRAADTFVRSALGAAASATASGGGADDAPRSSAVCHKVCALPSRERMIENQ